MSKIINVRSAITLLLIFCIFLAGNNSVSVLGQSGEDNTQIIPSNLVPITPENADQLQPIARLGHGAANQFKWTDDGNYLLVQGSKALWRFDARDWNAEPQIIRPEASDIRFILNSDINYDGSMVVTDNGNELSAHWMIEPYTSFFVGEQLPRVVKFSPDGRLATASEDNVVRLRMPSTDDSLIEFENLHEIPSSIAFSLDGLLMATVENHLVVLWNTQTGESIGSFQVAPRLHTAIAFSPDGSQIVIAVQPAADAPPETVGVFDLATYEEITRLVGPDRSVSELSFSGDGERLLVSSDTTTLLYDTTTMSQIDMPDPVGRLRNAQFSPDGSFIAGALNGEVYIFDGNDFSLIAKPPFFGIGGNVAFSPNNAYFAWHGGSTTSIIDLASGQEFARYDGAQFLSFASDSLAILTTRDGEVIWWDFANGLIPHQIKAADEAITLYYSEDQSRFVTGTWAGDIKVWDSATFEPVFSHVTPERLNGRTRLSADGRYAIAEASFAYFVWDVETGALITSDDELGLSYEINRAGTILVSQPPDGDTITVADLVSGTIRHTFQVSPTRQVILFHQNDQLLSISSGQFSGGDGIIYFYDVETGEEITTFPFEGEPYLASFSPNNDLISIYGDTSENVVLQLWDYESSQLLYTIAGVPHATTLEYNVDQSLFITGAGTVPAYLFDAGTGEEIKEFVGQGSGAVHYLFSPDETFIVTVNADGTTWLWGIQG